jgi:signal transduction histidine kinase
MTPNSHPKRANRSIRGRVMVLVGTGLAATLALAAYISWVTLRDLESQVERQQRAFVDSVAHQLDIEIDRKLARLYEVALDVRAALATGPPGDPTELLREAYLSSNEFDTIVVADRSGAVLGSAPLDRASVASGAAALGRVVAEGGRPVIRLLGPFDGNLRQVWAAVPVVDWQGAYSGFVGGMLELDGRRFTMLAGPVIEGRLGPADLLDEAGGVLATSGGHDRSSVATAVGSAGPEARSTSTGWRVRLHGPAATGGTPSLLIRWLAVVPLLVGLALLFAWGAGQSVRRPLETLTAAAERIAGGDLAQPVPALPADEVGRLARAFERMRRSLAESLASIAAANTVLEQRVERRTAELAKANEELRLREQAREQLLRKVISAQEDERKRIARELHDEIGQTLTALTVRLDLAQAAANGHAAEQPVAAARALARQSLEELHRLMHDLRPSVLDDLGLAAALHWFAEHRLVPHGISVRFEIGELPDRLPAEMETAVFRAAQEALTNVDRHARAERVLVQIGVEDRRLVVEIEDDGEGFEPAAMTPRPGDARGLGLLGMRERVELFGGSVSFDASPGSGTRVVIEVPLANVRTSHEQDPSPAR